MARYLKCQEKRIQRQFWKALEHTPAGLFPAMHIAPLKDPSRCPYRYSLSRGKRALRNKYNVDAEARSITVYDFGPRNEVYRA